MNKQIIIYIALGILLLSCKLKKDKKVELVKSEPIEKVSSRKTIELSEIAGAYSITSMESMPELHEVIPTVEIDETGSISGFSGCNSFSGIINLEEGELIKSLGSTRRACEGIEGDVERIFLENLAKITNVSTEDKFIRFFDGDRLLMEGKKINIREGAWQVISISGVESDQYPTFQFDGNNNINGSTGCNSFFGAVHQNAFKIKFIEVGATEKVCGGFDMTMESKFLQALSKVTEFKLQGNFAIFYNEGKELFKAENPR